MKIEDITFVKNGIHRPDEPRHFMRIKETNNLVTAFYRGKEIASSEKALKLQEVGFDLYDPVYYFPKEDVSEGLLETSGKSTHCPLKGDTEYYHIVLDEEKLENLAWQYSKPHEYSQKLKGYVAFDQSQIQVIERIDPE